jgi:hypothetical protein
MYKPSCSSLLSTFHSSLSAVLLQYDVQLSIVPRVYLELLALEIFLVIIFSTGITNGRSKRVSLIAKLNPGQTQLPVSLHKSFRIVVH